MLIYSQDRRSIYTCTIVQVDKSNPQLETEDQPHCIVGYNLDHSEEGFVLGEYYNRESALATLATLARDISKGKPILVVD